MQSSFLRTLIVCGACVHAAGSLGVEVAAFPLLITAMTSHVRGRAEAARVAGQLVSHVVSAAGMMSLGMLYVHWGELWHGFTNTKFLLGCLLLLSLQFTRLRHPPAMASGGAVLCGVDPIAVLGCVAVTGSALFAEPLLLRICRYRR